MPLSPRARPSTAVRLRSKWQTYWAAQPSSISLLLDATPAQTSTKSLVADTPPFGCLPAKPGCPTLCAHFAQRVGESMNPWARVLVGAALSLHAAPEDLPHGMKLGIQRANRLSQKLRAG